MHVQIEEEEESELAMDDGVKCSPASATCRGSAMAASYYDQIRSLLDSVDRPHQLKVAQEGIQLHYCRGWRPVQRQVEHAEVAGRHQPPTRAIHLNLRPAGDPLLSKIDKFMVGIPMLARRLTEIKAAPTSSSKSTTGSAAAVAMSSATCQRISPMSPMRLEPSSTPSSRCALRWRC